MQEFQRRISLVFSLILVMMSVFPSGLVQALGESAVEESVSRGDMPGLYLPVVLAIDQPVPAPDGPVPLPENCTDVTPDDGSESCCLYGYVYFAQGQPLSGVAVTIRTADGQTQVVTTTRGYDSMHPYFATALNRVPLSVTVGSWITLSASFGGFTRVLTYQVRPAGQQVDLVLPTRTSNDPIVYVIQGDTEREIWSIHLDGSGKTFLRNGSDPDICSVDGRIAYVYNGDIHVMELDGTYVWNVTQGGGISSYSSFNPDWSPDCSQIVYGATFPGGDYQLVVMGPTGSNKRRLNPSITSEYREWYPDWSPDGKSIIYTHDLVTGSGGDVYVVDVATSIFKRLRGAGWYPVYSPDGRHIAYIDLRGDHPKMTVYIMSADGTKRSPCTRSDVVIWWPYWLSNSKLMYVYPYAIETVDVTETVTGTVCSNVVRITTGGSEHRTPTARHTYPPRATIHTVYPPRALKGYDTVLFSGMGQDADENGNGIVAYRWRSSLDGELSTAPIFSMSTVSFSLGIHTIYLEVQDNEGEWSPAAERTLVVTDLPKNLDTLIVTHRGRLATALGNPVSATQVMSRLFDLAAATHGRVLAVDSDPLIQQAYERWDQQPTNPLLANAVAQKIGVLVLQEFKTSPNLRYLVIAGDDRVVPFYRIKDETSYSETVYVSANDPVIPITTAVGAALNQNWFFTDDYYGARWRFDSISLYVPTLATGRLIGSDAEMVGQIDWFLAGHPINVQGTAVTGYGSMVDSAEKERDLFAADGLIPDAGLIGGSWGVTQLIDQIFTPRHTTVSLNEHATHYTLGTPAGESLTSHQILNSRGDLRGTLIWGPGCHMGLWAPPESREPLGSVQAFIRKGALVLGNTGFGWGYDNGIGLSEQLMVSYTDALLQGAQTTVGKALVNAKQDYYLQSMEQVRDDAHFSKALMELTLYGLPMTEVHSPDLLQEKTEAVSPNALQSFTVITDTDIPLWIESKTLSFSSCTPYSTPAGTIYQCGSGSMCSTGKPWQPYYYESFPVGKVRPHGVVLRSTQGSVVPSVNPVVCKAVWDPNAVTEEAPLDTPVWFPDFPLATNNLGNDGGLLVSLSQFYGPSQTQRLYNQVGVDIYYNISEDWSGPWLEQLESSIEATGKVSITVKVQDSSGIYQVVGAYIDSNGNWASQVFTPTGGTWKGLFPGNATTKFLIQAVDNVGNVAVYTQQGNYMAPGDRYQLYRQWLPVVMRP